MPYPPGVTEADIEGGRCPSFRDQNACNYECDKCREWVEGMDISELAWDLHTCEECAPIKAGLELHRLRQIERKYNRLRDRIAEALERTA